MKILNLSATRDALPYKELIDALEEGFRGDYDAPLRHHHYLKNEEAEDDVLLLMPAWRSEGYGGIKLVNVVPGNAKRGRAALSSSYVLFDRETGEHLLIADGGELTARRTAAASALAARRLARPASATHLIVGAGRVGFNLALAYREVLPITRTLVFDINPDNAERMVASLARRRHCRRSGRKRAISRGCGRCDFLRHACTYSCVAGGLVAPGSACRPHRQLHPRNARSG